MSSEKAFVSRSYMALWLLERFWCKPQNGQLAPKSQIFKMVWNHHGAQFHMWVKIQMPTTYIVVKEILSGLILFSELGSKNGQISSYWWEAEGTCS